jgi:hypothetical protein
MAVRGCWPAQRFMRNEALAHDCTDGRKTMQLSLIRKASASLSTDGTRVLSVC